MIGRRLNLAPLSQPVRKKNQTKSWLDRERVPTWFSCRPRFEYYWFMGVFESFGLAQINDLGFDLTMLNLKSGSTCFWIVLVKKCTYSSFFRNIWWTHCQEGIINHLLYCLVPEVSCIYTWIDWMNPGGRRESQGLIALRRARRNELIRQMSGCDVDAREEFPITLSPEHTPNHYPC